MKRPAWTPDAVIVQASLLLFILVLVWGGIGIGLRRDYQQALQLAESRTGNRAAAFGETVGRSIAAIDEALQHIRDLYSHDPEHFTLVNWLRDKTFLHNVGVDFLAADATGRVVLGSIQNVAQGFQIGDRGYFREQVSASDDHLFIGEPMIARVTGALRVPLSRRIAAPNGQFAGIVSATLAPDELAAFYELSQTGDRFAMLVGRDSIVRASWPDGAMVGQSVLPPIDPTMARMIGPGPSGKTPETIVDHDMIVSYRGVTGSPLFIVVGLSRQSAFASYEKSRRGALRAGALLSLIVLIVGGIIVWQQRRLSLFHRNLQLTLENISQGVLMVDQQRRTPVVNRRAGEILGIPPGIATSGGSFDAVLEWQRRNGEFRDDLTGDERIGRLVEAGGIDSEVPFYERTRADGTAVEVRTTVLPDGCAVRTFTDVTERKRTERELASARDAARAGIRARNEFLAVMSHEIRTPMNGIIGAAGLLHEMRPDDEQGEYIEIIRESSEHLLSLVQNILDFSRLDAGALRLEEIAFDPAGLITGVTAMLSGQAKEKGLALTATIDRDMPPRVSGDPSRLRQVLINLIGNGIKFTDSGDVSVSAWVAASDQHTFTLGIDVSDSGIGIGPDARQQLFSAFTQEDSSISRRFGGSGLGLAICRGLIALMGGTIDVESAPGAGSTFHFRVNVGRVASAQKPESLDEAGPAQYRKLKVLVAEDNVTNRHVATRMLTRMGHEVHAVEDGAGAITAAATGDFDVILMDMMMPVVDGITATRTIRAGAPPSRDVPIIGLTANSLPSDRAACEAAGMNDFVTKPVTSDHLRTVLRQIHSPAHGLPTQPVMARKVTMDEVFLNRLADDIGTDGVAELIQVFLEDAPARMAAIRRALARGAMQTLRLEAHALAGAARNVGLPRLGHAADQLRNATEEAGANLAFVIAIAEALNEGISLLGVWAAAHPCLVTPAA